MPEKSPAVGIILGILGSIGINVGMNIQCMGVHRLSEEEKEKPWRSCLWIIGMVVFIVSTVANFLALMFAAASILVPIEALQLVVNVVFNRVVNKAPISMRLAGGSALAVLGTVLVVSSGSNKPTEIGVNEALHLWTSWVWWVYLAFSLVVGVACEVQFWRTRRKQWDGVKDRFASSLQPVIFSISSALWGAAQSVIHAKVVSEMLYDAGVKPDVTPHPLQHWLFWIEVVLVAIFGPLWVFRQNQGLVLYDPLLIIPLLQAMYILFAAIGSGIFFKEFWTLGEGPLGLAGGWIMFVCGIICVNVGLYLICPSAVQEKFTHEPVGEQAIVIFGDFGKTPSSGSTEVRSVSALVPISYTEFNDGTTPLAQVDTESWHREALFNQLRTTIVLGRGLSSLLNIGSEASFAPRHRTTTEDTARGRGCTEELSLQNDTRSGAGPPRALGGEVIGTRAPRPSLGLVQSEGKSSEPSRLDNNVAVRAEGKSSDPIRKGSELDPSVSSRAESSRSQQSEAKSLRGVAGEAPPSSRSESSRSKKSEAKRHSGTTDQAPDARRAESGRSLQSDARSHRSVAGRSQQSDARSLRGSSGSEIIDKE